MDENNTTLTGQLGQIMAEAAAGQAERAATDMPVCFLGGAALRARFENQLKELNADLITMGAQCESAITLAMQALEHNDRQAAHKAVCLERELDHQEREIENLCLTLLLRQQPVARDLRLVSAALKMITDMERIGDQAADIASIVMERELQADALLPDLTRMADAVIDMLTDSVDAFVRRDLDLARSVLDHDDTVDDFFASIRKSLIERISQEPGHGEEAIDLLMIAKYLERIGDHAANIAEWVDFSITGSHGEMVS